MNNRLRRYFKLGAAALFLIAGGALTYTTFDALQVARSNFAWWDWFSLAAAVIITAGDALPFDSRVCFTRVGIALTLIGILTLIWSSIDRRCPRPPK